MLFGSPPRFSGTFSARWVRGSPARGFSVRQRSVTPGALEADGANYYVYKMGTAEDLEKMERFCSAYKPRAFRESPAAEFSYEVIRDYVFLRTTVKNVRPRIAGTEPNRTELCSVFLGLKNLSLIHI